MRRIERIVALAVVLAAGCTSARADDVEDMFPPTHITAPCRDSYGGRWAEAYAGNQPYGTGGVLAWRVYDRGITTAPPWAKSESAAPVFSGDDKVAVDCGRYATRVTFSFLR